MTKTKRRLWIIAALGLVVIGVGVYLWATSETYPDGTRVLVRDSATMLPLRNAQINVRALAPGHIVDIARTDGAGLAVLKIDKRTNREKLKETWALLWKTIRREKTPQRGPFLMITPSGGSRVFSERIVHVPIQHPVWRSPRNVLINIPLESSQLPWSNHRRSGPPSLVASQSFKTVQPHAIEVASLRNPFRSHIVGFSSHTNVHVVLVEKGAESFFMNNSHWNGFSLPVDSEGRFEVPRVSGSGWALAVTSEQGFAFVRSFRQGMSVKLTPWAVLNGRLMDGEFGVPLRKVAVNLAAEGNSPLKKQFADCFFDTETDRDGKFQLTKLMPDRRYSLRNSLSYHFNDERVLQQEYGFNVSVVAQPGTNVFTLDHKAPPMQVRLQYPATIMDGDFSRARVLLSPDQHEVGYSLKHQGQGLFRGESIPPGSYFLHARFLKLEHQNGVYVNVEEATLVVPVAVKKVSTEVADVGTFRLKENKQRPLR